MLTAGRSLDIWSPEIIVSSHPVSKSPLKLWVPFVQGIVTLRGGRKSRGILSACACVMA